MLKRHGGFQTGDHVEIKGKMGNWHGIYIILDFELFKVKVYDKKLEHAKYYPSSHLWVSIFDVRHPFLKVRGK